MKLGRVAVGARALAMALFEGPAGSRVPELLSGAISPLDHREVRSGVLRVTRGTSLSLPLPVEPKPLIQEPADVPVTTYAEHFHRFLASTVTLGAVERTLQLPMRLGEWPR